MRVKTTEVKARTKGTTVKVSVHLDPALWRRIRIAALQRGTTAKDFVAEAAERLLKEWEKKEVER